ncbi:MAG: hypothetical protein KatS3mg118_0967 [Paracoccaceae bacterium]|nr:MAG: hypothetical protein KatS3mg118_0967 [Paracoccaceae bacterium]
MSRIGKKPVPRPERGDGDQVEGQSVSVKGPKGELALHRDRRRLESRCRTAR